MKSPLRKPKPIDLVKHQKGQVIRDEIRLHAKRICGDNLDGIQWQINCSKTILRLLKKHYKDPQRDLFADTTRIEVNPLLD